MVPSDQDIKQILRSSVTKKHRYEQGEIIYGVRDFNHHDNQGWSSTGKTFKNKHEAETYYNAENPLRDSEIHDTVFYRAKVDTVGSVEKNVFVIDSKEETEMILTDIDIIDRKKPGEFNS